MPKRKVPKSAPTGVNFESGLSGLAPLSEEHRRTLLRRESSARRRTALDVAPVLPKAVLEALSQVSRLANGGKPFPIHFDIRFEAGVYSETRKFTVIDAAMVRNIINGDGNVLAVWAGRASRSAAIRPHFILRVGGRNRA